MMVNNLKFDLLEVAFWCLVAGLLLAGEHRLSLGLIGARILMVVKAKTTWLDVLTTFSMKSFGCWAAIWIIGSLITALFVYMGW